MPLQVFSIPSLPRVNSGLARTLPIATTVLAAIITILPVRVPGYAALTPAFALMAVYHWTIYRPDLLPAIGLFAIGLGQDLHRRDADDLGGALCDPAEFVQSAHGGLSHGADDRDFPGGKRCVGAHPARADERRRMIHPA